MPALTVKAITKALSEYVRPDEDIVAKLNFVMPRLYAMGMWRDLLFDWDIETTNAYFSLPEHADSLLGAMLGNSPVDVQNQWHDYRIGGYASDGPNPIFGVVDDGFCPIKEELIEETATEGYSVTLQTVAPATTLPDEGTVTIVYERNTDAVLGTDTIGSETLSLAGAITMTTAHYDIDDIVSISFTDVPDYVDVKAHLANDSVGGDSERHLARVRGDGVARYRRYRFSNSAGSTVNVKTFLKRAWQPVLLQSDIVHLGNINAIKHGLLGMIAEDNADIERAQYHWTISKNLLEEEIDSVRGAAKPKLKINPTGTFSTTPNLL